MWSTYAAAAALLVAAPAPVQLTLPVPTGPDRIGTVSLHLVDSSRPDPWVPAERVRELMVQIWYPAKETRGHPRAGWVTPGVAARINPPGSGLVLPVTHGHTGAPAAPGRRPVVLYSPGFGLERTGSTALVEDLASHGYVVVTIDHPHDAQFVEFPDGRIAEHAVPVPTDPEEAERIIGKALDVRVADVRFVLDRLGSGSLRLPRGLTMDLGRVGMFGSSLGGATAAEAMLADRRIKAGLNLDGSFLGRVLDEGLDRPFLMLGSTHGSDGEEDETWTRMWAGLRGPRHHLELNGAGHLSFTDLQTLLPQAGTPPADAEPLIGTIDARRSIAAQRAYIRAFYDRYLRACEAPLLDGPSRRYPEMLFRG
ncbi:lipase [Virgisporangium aliadipatigenens]|uniref:Lipase n=1 Tax=Virgisporangium aliadipatigenens TaxID=741659 RepID=A0A8J3YQQ9_9ACTN|nr:hydrolase [Virgisporangium aliadipatigenens]GIJ48230.1 lipase [Virgisporangium aliadipatigenens]